MRQACCCFAMVTWVALGLGITPPCGAGEPSDAESEKGRNPTTVRDRMWVWGNPGMAEEGPHTLATFAQAGPAERAKLLNVPNIIMAGNGLPRDDQLARQLMEQIAEAPRVVWEIAADAEDGGPPFAYDEILDRLRRLADTHAQIEGVLLDDMSSLGIDHGFKPKHIRHVRQLLPGEYARVRVWGVVYTMNLDREGINDYIAELDVINLWTWHAKDVVDIEANVARCKGLFPEKPIVLGLYLYDYGEGRRIPLDLLEHQCSTALKLAHAGQIDGMVFLTITNDSEAVAWAADWIERVGTQTLAIPSPDEAGQDVSGEK